MSSTSKTTVKKDFRHSARSQIAVKPKGEKLYPMSFRVTAGEKTQIKSNAGDNSVSQYLRLAALKGEVLPRKTNASIKIDMAARILGMLGQSDLHSNISKIANAAQQGALPVTEDLTQELQNACALIIAMRQDLIEALGIKAQS